MDNSVDEQAIVDCCLAAQRLNAVEYGSYGIKFAHDAPAPFLDALAALQSATTGIVVAGYRKGWADNDAVRDVPWVRRFEDVVFPRARRFYLAVDALSDAGLKDYWLELSCYAREPGEARPTYFTPGLPVLIVDLDSLDFRQLGRNFVHASPMYGLFSGGRTGEAARRYIRKQTPTLSGAHAFVPIVPNLRYVGFTVGDEAIDRVVSQFFEGVTDLEDLSNFVPGHWISALQSDNTLDPEDLLKLEWTD
ncbi:MAG: hypothetical protein QNI99_10505 [Woeseiaceae bacterium]|nr:hypothetical protein [Woeseiaceae bacterium]